MSDGSSLYWRDGKGRLNCQHGVILYGSGCVKCERELVASIANATIEERCGVAAVRKRYRESRLG